MSRIAEEEEEEEVEEGEDRSEREEEKGEAAAKGGGATESRMHMRRHVRGESHHFLRTRHVEASRRSSEGIRKRDRYSIRSAGIHASKHDRGCSILLLPSSPSSTLALSSASPSLLLLTPLTMSLTAPLSFSTNSSRSSSFRL